MVDMHQDAKHRGIYLMLGTNPEGDSCFSIYQNNGIKMHFVFKETIQCKPFFFFLHAASCHFDFRARENEYWLRW